MDHPLFVLYFFLHMSVIFVRTFSKIVTSYGFHIMQLLKLYTNHMMFLIISAF